MNPNRLKPGLHTGAQRSPLLSILFLLLFIIIPSAPAANPTPESAPAPITTPLRPSISPPELNRSISDILSQREYTWRMPHETTLEEKNQADASTLVQFFRSISDTLKNWGKTISDKWESFKKWYDRVFGKHAKPNTPSVSLGGAYSFLQWVLFVVIAIMGAVVGVLAYRLWKRRNKTPVPLQAEAIQPTPDLSQANVTADQLPEDGWLNLARDLIAQGELRLALRAFYLASLAHLALRNLITIARFKSNRDYENELRRRSHALPEVSGVFTDNVRVFDGAWYGLHEVTPESLEDFRAKVERLRQC